MATLEILDEAPRPKRSPSLKKLPPVEIEEPECPYGYIQEQVERIIGGEGTPESKAFWRWMSGQTMMSCEGVEWDEKKKEMVDNECKGKGHGGVVYASDLQRYAKGHRRIFD